MKNITLIILSFLIAFSSCTKEQAEIMPLEVSEIKTRISNTIKQTHDAFDWGKADNLLIYSTLIRRDSIALIGYIPEGKTEDDYKFNNINIKEEEWIEAKNELQNKILNAVNQHGKIYEKSYLFPPEPEDRQLPYFYAKIFDLELIDELRRDTKVRYIEPPAGGFFVLNPVFNAGCGPDGQVKHCDRIFVGDDGDYYSWHFAHEAHRINQAWKVSQNKGAGIKVAVFDTGLTRDFIDNYHKGESSGRTIGLDNNFALNNSALNTADYIDVCSHGTNISGIIAGPKTKEGGPFGIAYRANLYMYKSLDDVLVGTDDWGDILSAGIFGIGWNSDDEIEGVKRSLLDAVRDGVNVINMSIGSHFISNLVDDALRAAHDADIIMFAAAGTYQANAVADLVQNSLPVVYPANSDYTLGVTGLRESGQTCYECGDGPEVDFVVHMQKGDGARAVTYGIGDTQHADGTYSDEDGFLDDNFGGSSAATATMSGIATLLWSEHPDWTREQVVNQLILSSSNYPNKDNSHGWGTVNAYNALTENLANPSPDKNHILIDKISISDLPGDAFEFDDSWMVTINGDPMYLHRKDDGISGVPTMFAFDEDKDCNNSIWDLTDANILNIDIWVEGATSRDCKFNDEVVTETDYDRYTTTKILNPENDEGTFSISYSSTENPGIDYSFEFHYTRFKSEELPDVHSFDPIPNDYCEGPAVLFYQENNAVNLRYIASAMPGSDVYFDFSSLYTDLNDVVRSIKLRDVKEGTVLVLFDDDNKDDDSHVSTETFEIYGNDWVEIKVKRFINDKVIGTLENSFEDDDVRITYHRNDNLDGKVSLYQSLENPVGPTIDFYDNKNLEGDLQCSIEIQNGSSVSFTDYEICDNDEAESVVLYDIPVGMQIQIFDDTERDTPYDNDWLRINVLQDIKELKINSLELSESISYTIGTTTVTVNTSEFSAYGNEGHSFINSVIDVTYNHVDGLHDGLLNDNGASWVVVGVECMVNKLEVEIEQTQVADCIGFGVNTLKANVTEGSPPFTYKWREISTGDIVGEQESVDVFSIGSYSVEVRGSRGCSAVFASKTIQSSRIDKLRGTITDASCNEADGRIRLTVSGGTPPFTYQWDAAANNQTSSTAYNLEADSYTVTVTDSGGCTKSKSFQVKEDINFRIDLTTRGTSSCHINDGWAEVRLRGLEGTPAISWSGSNQTTPRIEGLAPGNYTVMVLDEGSDCSLEKSFTIRQPSVRITGGGTRIVYPGTVPAATLYANLSGCTMCTYLWSTDEMGQRITVSESGRYSVTVDDGNGCTYQSSTSVNFAPPRSSGSGNDTATGPGTGPGTGPNTGPDSGPETGLETDTGTSGFWDFIKKTLLGFFNDLLFWGFPVLHAFDPNDIAGNVGYEEDRWISINERLGYLIRFENDPEFATGPAQTVTVRHPLDPNIDPYSLRLGNFGFGTFNFTIPANSITYNQRLDVTDSLGLFVDVIAGIDVQNDEAFWILKSIDPATGQTPIDASLGFLGVTDTTLTRFNDTIPKLSEGYVSFSVQPKNTLMTGDTCLAQASIIFDQNAPIETNVWKNTIDAFPPTTLMNPFDTVIGDSIHISWTSVDDIGGVGVQDYDLYVSTNGGDYELAVSPIDTNAYVFIGTEGNTYSFGITARDLVGNVEELDEDAAVSLFYYGCYLIAEVDCNDDDLCTRDFVDEDCTCRHEAIESMVIDDNSTLPSSTIQVKYYIKSNSIIEAGNNVTFKAGNSIKLNENFEVKQGAVFSAIIEQCLTP